MSRLPPTRKTVCAGTGHFFLARPPVPPDHESRHAKRERELRGEPMLRRVCGLVLLITAAGLVGAADAPTGATVTDADGKEVKVSALKFGTGTRRLTWADPDDKKGLLALELREPHSTSYAKGVVTFVPVGSVESIKYDYDKQLASVAVKGLPEPLAGTLQYKGINALAFDGTVGDKAAKFGGGVFTKDHIKGVAFAGAKPVPARKGTPWQVQIDQPKAMDPTLKAGNFKFLYQYAGGVEVLSDTAFVRKGDPLKLDDAVTQVTPLAVDQNTHVAVVEVLSGETERVVVIPQEVEKDGKKGVLVGLVGEVEAGWKLFPLHTIKVMKRPKKD